MRFVGSLAFVLSAAGVAAAPAAAAITSIEIQRTESFAEGATFGATGAYVKVVGVARGELDPAAPANRGIVNLDRAPRNERGRVDYDGHPPAGCGGAARDAHRLESLRRAGAG